MAEISVAEDERHALAHGVSLHEAFRVWLPAGQIAVMHHMLVERTRGAATKATNFGQAILSFSNHVGIELAS